MAVYRGGTHEVEEQSLLRDRGEEDVDARPPSPTGDARKREITDMATDQNQRNKESKKSETDGGKNQMMFVVFISIMLVLVSVTFAQSLAPFMVPKYTNPNPASQEILIVYMIVGFLIIVALFLQKHVITERSTGTKKQSARDNIRTILRDYLSIVGMSFFFPFACILDLSNIVAATSCDEIWKLCGDGFYRDYLVDVFYHLIRILFMGAELAFCCKFHGTRFKHSGPVRCGLMIVMAANLGLWFLSLVYEAADRDGHPEDEAKRCSNGTNHTLNPKFPENWSACVHKTSSAHQVMNAMTRYLYPFAIEFSLLVGEFLVTKFVSSTKRTVDFGSETTPAASAGSGDIAQQPQTTVVYLVAAHHIQTPEGGSVAISQPPGPDGNVVGDQQNLATVDRDPDQSNQVNASGIRMVLLGQLLSMLIIAVGLFASFLYMSLVFSDSYANDRNITDIDSLNWGKVYETYATINYMLINALMVVGYVCSYGFEIQEKKLHGLDWLVLVSAFGPLMRELITVIALLASYSDMSPDDFPAILICNRLANWVQLILQAPFIFLSERWWLTEEQRRQHPRFLCQEKILKAVIFCLAITNLTNWISDSIILTHSLSIRSGSMDKILDPGNWPIVEHISLPLMIFYRFNSFLLFTRAYIGD